MIDLAGVYRRRAQLLRELAGLEETLAEAAPVAPSPVVKADEVLGLAEAAAMLGEPPNTFRQRLEYRKALVSRPGERRLRYSRAELERIRRDRLSGNGSW